MADKLKPSVRAILQGFVDDLTSGGRNRPNMLSIDHDKLCARIAQAEAALKGAPQQ